MTAITRRTVLLGVTAVSALAVKPALADWPERPITIIHGLQPGGGVDITARILAEGFTQRLGQQVVVEPKPGAASTLAAAHVARAAPDGYTIALFPSTYAAAVAMRQTLPFRPIADFAAIGMVNQLAYVIATYSESPIGDLQQLLEAGRNASQPLLYGTPGKGSAQHLLMEWLSKLAGIRLQHVPFRGGPQAVTELLAKRLDLVVDAPLTLSEHIKAGRLRPLAVTTRERAAWLPETPAVAEAGFSEFDVSGWMGLVAPAGLPARIVQRLNTELSNIVADNAVVQKFAALGTQARASTAANFKARLAGDIERWLNVIAQSGIERI
jgi:tripartite-type tricarboxylate transporter receptor subunit TctC